LAAKEPGELEDLRPDLELVVQPRTFRTGTRRSLGICPAASSPAAFSSATWRWRASLTAPARSRRSSSLSSPSEGGGASRSSVARAFNPWEDMSLLFLPRAQDGPTRHHYPEQLSG